MGGTFGTPSPGVPIIEPRLTHEIQRIGVPDDVCKAFNMEVPEFLQVDSGFPRTSNVSQQIRVRPTNN